jgi:hypothetical protein
VDPALSPLQERIVTLIESRWGNDAGPEEDIALVGVHIRVLKGAEDLVPGKLVYLVQAQVNRRWWKYTTEVILVLRPKGEGFEPLLVYEGGSNAKGMCFKRVDLGMKERREALLIEDYGSGNMQTVTNSYLFLYDPARRTFKEVFGELTTFMLSLHPFFYESTLEFRKGNQSLKDIVVLTDLYRDGKDRQCDYDHPEKRVSVFRWKGTRYVGHLNVPE